MPIEKSPKISIITPSYNQGEFIERTIQSILNQNYPHLEYIIIDGASTDNTLNIIKKYEAQLIFVSEPDNGQTDAINKGFKMATGEIIAWLNSDDTYEPDALKNIYEAFLNYPDSDLIYGDCHIVDRVDNIIGKMDGGKFSYRKNLRNLICTIPQPATFFRNSLFTDIGNLDTNFNFSMDFEYWIRAAKMGKSMTHISKKIANFRWYEGTKSAQVYSNNIPVNENRLIQYKFNKPYYLLDGLIRKIFLPIKKAIIHRLPVMKQLRKPPASGGLIFFDEKSQNNVR